MCTDRFTVSQSSHVQKKSLGRENFIDLIKLLITTIYVLSSLVGITMLIMLLFTQQSFEENEDPI